MRRQRWARGLAGGHRFGVAGAAAAAMLGVAWLSAFSLISVGPAGAGTGASRQDSTLPDSTIYIRSFHFDPLKNYPVLAAGQRYGLLPESERTYYVVQFDAAITGAMRMGVEQAGVRVIGYIPYNAYLAEADARSIEVARRAPSVRWIGLFEPAFKLSPALRQEYDATINAKLDRLVRNGMDHAPARVDTSNFVPVIIELGNAARINEVTSFLSGLGATSIEPSATSGGAVSALVRREHLDLLARHPAVLGIDRDLPAVLFNDRANWTVQSNDPITHATPMHAHGLAGLGETVTVCDSGLDYDHVMFRDSAHPVPVHNHRKVTAYYAPDGKGDYGENPAPLDPELPPDAPAPVEHGTHVCGTVAGDDGGPSPAHGTIGVYDGDGNWDPNAPGSDAGEIDTPHDGIAYKAMLQMQDISKFSVGIGIPDILADLFRPAVDPAFRSIVDPNLTDPQDPSSASFVHTNSWGQFTEPDYIYAKGPRQIDAFLWDPTMYPDGRNHDLVVIFAAGNAGPDPYTLGPQAVAKDSITVGASGNAENSNSLALDPTANTRYFSSRGPTCDGRIKPDIMAPGRSLWSAMGCDPFDPNNPGTCEGTTQSCSSTSDCPHDSCVSGGCTLSGGPCNTSADCPNLTCVPPPSQCYQYRRLSGTSMAAPVVAGSAAIVREYYREGWQASGTYSPGNGITPSAALIKATLINGASQMTGGDAYGNGEAFYPNHQQGWGRINLDDSLFFAGENQKLAVHDERTGVATTETLGYQFTVPAGCGPLKATLVWTDPDPGTDIPCDPNDVTHTTAPALVNDLDLYVQAPAGTVYRGNRFASSFPFESLPADPSYPPEQGDRRNNVEQVQLYTGLAAGTWTVSVHGFYVPMGVPDPLNPPISRQPFALVINCLDPDKDHDGEPDYLDCAPHDPTIHHGAVETCNGKDDNCDGIVDNDADTDGDGIYNCLDTDDDNDGDPDVTDCAPLNNRAAHTIVEALPSGGGLFGSCHDGIDNDCDGIVDMDCAIDVDTAGQHITTGSVSSGSLADARAASTQSPTTYENLQEGGTGNHRTLGFAWDFTSTSSGSQQYTLNVEAYKETSSENFTFSWLSRTSSGACSTAESGWNAQTISTPLVPDNNVAQSVPIGALPAGKVCVKIADSATSGDSSADTVHLDRLYLFPAIQACPDVDGDGYTTTCTGCSNAHCPTLDCADNDAGRSPGLTEGPTACASCTDGKDNDCDGLVDAADTASCGPQPDTVAQNDYQNGPGTVTSGDYSDTAASDSFYEVIQETNVGNVSKLKHTWTFPVSPGCSHTLNFEGSRTSNSEGDNFQFYWATDPSSDANFTAISGALISSTFFPIGGVSASFTTPSTATTIYIRVMDTNQTSGPSLDSVSLGRLTLKTP